MRNDYGSLVETWKVDLIVNRAKRKGFRRDEIEDVQQEIIQAVLAFKYDPSRANGATETTALTALVDRQLAFIRRGEARRRRHERRYRELSGATTDRPVEPSEDDHQNRIALKIDVQQMVASLSPVEQAVCAGLCQDETRRGIAKRLGIPRYGLDRLIAGIREHFVDAGLDGYRGAE